MSESKKRPIPADTGAFISLEEMNVLTDNHDAEFAAQKSFGQHVKAICFGRDKIIELLDQPGAVALRIYYGLKIDTDGDGIKEKKMVLVAVDEEGNDILPPSAEQAKAAAAAGIQSKELSAKILDAGVPCPTFCSGGKGGKL
ncbi:hypothetical protein DVR12_26000 [Chitinophaga silvatica]|uniref:Uncharacterized protein n=1 Tax=Chitinophaga silvatica TaxID=2282649 RepID=A0A3E1Y2V7_9BACT|nr:hypothetical protein [Chitinophaga silvatica]RFS18837.1 hypothetical protein DVR12_26000 [Chitinophaga silvatica]